MRLMLTIQFLKSNMVPQYNQIQSYTNFDNNIPRDDVRGLSKSFFPVIKPLCFYQSKSP